MRTDKQLIQLVLDNFDKHFKSGLCNLALHLLFNRDITYNEYCLLMEIIKLGRPSKPYGFWWPVGQREPRIEFLNKLLKQL